MKDKKDKFLILLPWIFTSLLVLLVIWMVGSTYQQGNTYLDPSMDIYVGVLFFLIPAILWAYVFPANTASLRLWKKYNC